MIGTTSGYTLERVDSILVMSVYRGNTFTLPITWGNTDPIDVTDFLVELVMRDAKGNTMLTLGSSNGKAVVGGVDGSVVFNGTVEDTRAVKSDGVWAIKFTTPSGSTGTMASGSLKSIREI